MKANFNKRQCLQLSTLVVTGLLCASTASAAELVSAVPSNYARSEIGTITGSRVTTEIDAAPHKGVVKGLGGDPASFNFHQQGKSKLFLVLAHECRPRPKNQPPLSTEHKESQWYYPPRR